jgi:hypothetical protein
MADIRKSWQDETFSDCLVSLILPEDEPPAKKRERFEKEVAADADADATTTAETLHCHCVVLTNFSDVFAAQLLRWQGGDDTRKSRRRLELVVEDEHEQAAARELLR